MSTLDDLKDYLLGKDDDVGYLLNPDNNGKTVMLSGAWGSGKTHFWQNEIIKEQKEIEKDGEKKKKYTQDEYESGLSYKLKDKKKACVYVSLYGKPSMESIELDLYMNAYKNIEGNADFISKTCSVFTSLGKNLGNMAHRGAGSTFEWLGNLVDKDKLKKAGEYLEDGGLICFDDFERKSKNIDLNDLFGFISQLTLEYNCKVVIILNIDVFEGEEKNVFKTVKEKTVNKFFYFEPTIEELFNSIYESNEKYKKLDDNRNAILHAIQETEELNARIYIQVLDNCLEWIEKGYDNNILRVLVLNTICFIKYHFILSYYTVESHRELNTEIINNHISYEEMNYSPLVKAKIVMIYQFNDRKLTKDSTKRNINIIRYLQQHATISEKSVERQKIYLDEIMQNEKEIVVIVKFGYELFVGKNIDKDDYEVISQFIQSGILPKNNKEPSS